MLKRNIFINYVSQLYMAALSVLVVPIYLKLLGAETYGLVGVFVMAQVLMQVLDIGLSAMLSREATKFIVNPETGPIFRYVFDKVFKFFLGVSLLLVVVFLPLVNLYGLDWLNYKSLNPTDVLIALSFIVVIVALRFLVTPLRSVLMGLEKHVWLNMVIIVTGTLKYLGIIPIIVFYSRAPEVFFVYELCIAILEAVLIFYYTLRLLPKKKLVRTESLATAETTSKLLKFSLGHGFTAILWLIMTQIDRVVLSKTLPLDQFGYFSAVVTAAWGIMILSGPLSRALLPRMTALIEKREITALVTLYRKSTRLISFAVVPIGVLIAGFSAEILWVWTGNKELVSYGANVLFWYALGNTAVALAAFPYYLQYAYGELRLHVIGNIINFIISIPLIVISAIQYGAVGAGVAWAIMQVSYLLIATYFMHKKFLTGMHWRWLIVDVLPGFVASGVIVFFIKGLNIVTIEMDRLIVFLRLGLISIPVFAVCFVLNKSISK